MSETMHESDVETRARAVEAEITYVSPESRVNRRFVAPMGWMVRNSGDLSGFERESDGYTHQGGVQPPAGEAHVDTIPERADGMAADLYARTWPDGPGYERFIFASIWRCFSEPPQNWPLALCDGSSVEDSEGTPNTLVVVDELPEREAMLGSLPGEDEMLQAAIFSYGPNHRWWYFSNMTRDELVMIVFHDSAGGRAWRTPHTAFRDPSFSAANVRESIEFRVVAYFESRSCASRELAGTGTQRRTA